MNNDDESNDDKFECNCVPSWAFRHCNQQLSATFTFLVGAAIVREQKTAYKLEQVDFGNLNAFLLGRIH